MITYDDSYKIKQGAHFAVSEVRISTSQPRRHTQLHCHRDMELLLIDKGNTVMQIAGREVKAGEGDLILVNPYEVHSGETLGGSYAHRCICFDLEQLGIPHSGQILSGDIGYVSAISDTNAVKPYFSACFAAIKDRSAGWEMRAKGNLLVMFSALTDRIGSAAPTKAQNFAKAVLDYMEAHFSEEITSKEVAERFSYDHSYFCRKFKTLFSQNFSDFLNGYRILKAKEMLHAHSVSDTATACGFQNISYFSKVFKALVGIPPSSYRKNHLQYDHSYIKKAGKRI